MQISTWQKLEWNRVVRYLENELPRVCEKIDTDLAAELRLVVDSAVEADWVEGPREATQMRNTQASRLNKINAWIQSKGMSYQPTWMAL